MNSSGVGRLLSLAGRFGRLFSRKEQVGMDPRGNIYFRWQEKNYEGEWVERRVVEYPDDDYDPTTVPVIWKTWLQGGRLEPPTAEDMQMAAKHSADMKAKVEALELAEKQRKFKARSLQDVDQSDHTGAAVSALLGGTEGPAPSRPEPTKPTGTSEPYTPDGWDPNQKP